jgi:hypothetical protein
MGMNKSREKERYWTRPEAEDGNEQDKGRRVGWITSARGWYWIKQGIKCSV